MKMLSILIILALVPCIFLLSKCNTGNNQKENNFNKDTTSVASGTYGGYRTPEEWGHHIVAITDCGDCHTPKKMTPEGPVPNMDRELSGHPQACPLQMLTGEKWRVKG